SILVTVIVPFSCIASFFYGFSYGLRYGVVYGSIVGLICTIAAILTELLTEGWGSSMSDERQFLRPNEGIRRSFRHAVKTACICGPIAGIASGVSAGLAFGLGGVAGWPILGGGFTLIFTVAFGITFFIYYGGTAFIEHYVLRWLLWKAGSIPRN